MQLGTAANSRTLQAQQAVLQASKDPDAAKKNVMLKQEEASKKKATTSGGSAIVGLKHSGRRLHYKGPCTFATADGKYSCPQGSPLISSTLL